MHIKIGVSGMKKIYSNEYLELLEDDDYYIKVLQKGYDMKAFNNILIEFPRFKLMFFTELKKAVESAEGNLVKIGIKKPVVEVVLTKDRYKAYVIINLTHLEFETYDKNEIVEEIIKALEDANVVHGIDINNIIGKLRPLDKIQVAEATYPIDGEDAIIEYYKIEEVKPKVVEDGTVNHYELNLINKVNKGDWVGERIEPKEGTPGLTVTGEVIPAPMGRQHKLEYDRKTIEEVYNEEEQKTFLYAKRTGAVIYQKDIISISNYLEIDGDVSFDTGNIDFDGSVEIKHSIEDNFIVRADHDIQVMGDMGVGSIDTIESRDGSIYIRGGIAGKNRAKLISNRDLYTKFASECTIECDGTVHIGYYAINCNIKAKEVILESYKSRIIGGHIEADIRVAAGEIGNKTELLTKITVAGFSRDKLKKEYEVIVQTIEKMKQKVTSLKNQLSTISLSTSDPQQRKTFDSLNDEYYFYTKKLQLLYDQQKKYISYLNTKGEGEIKVNHCIYPNVSFNIKNQIFNNAQMITNPVTYYVTGNVMKKVT